MARPGAARLGMARQGWARRGEAGELKCSLILREDKEMVFDGTGEKRASLAHVDTSSIRRLDTALDKAGSREIVDSLVTTLRATTAFAFPEIFDRALGGRRAWRVG